MEIIKQTKDGICVPMSYINLMNYHYNMDLDKNDLDWICLAMNTDDEGTYLQDFYPMIKPFFYTVIRNKFSKKTMDTWLGYDDRSVIISYCTDKKINEWHVANIFSKKDEIYKGANFYTNERKYFHRAEEGFVNKLYNRKGVRIIYLRVK